MISGKWCTSMKVMTILGTRPEIIRLNIIIKKLDRLAEKHILVHTGQNFTFNLSDVFFSELNLRKPDYLLNNNMMTLGSQLSTIYKNLETILMTERPDKVLILGDTNSALSAIMAERLGFPVYHMEAGNRCFDLEVPEEKNRRVVDAISSYNLPYTPQSKENLIKEGIPLHRIFVCGNPIYEVLTNYAPQINSSTILTKLSVQANDYFLVTIHRSENVDYPDRLEEIISGLNLIAESFNKRLICSMHPRTQSQIIKNPTLEVHPLVEFHEPFGFFDFVKLEQNALCVLTDSGTVQEECCLFHIPTVTIRKTTERPETLACGSNMLSGINAQQILNCTKVMTQLPRNWTYPAGYDDENVSDKVIKLLLGGLNIV